MLFYFKKWFCEWWGYSLIGYTSNGIPTNNSLLFNYWRPVWCERCDKRHPDSPKRTSFKDCR